LIQTGIVLIGLGLLAELLTRIYMDVRHRRIYTLARQTPTSVVTWEGPHPVTVPAQPGVLQ